MAFGSRGKGLRAEVSVFAAADVHALGGESDLPAVLSRAAAYRPAAALLGGDYVGRGRPPETEEERLRRWQPRFALADVRKQVADALGGEVKTYLTYGSHDKHALEGADGFFCGPASGAGYHLYGVSFCQMRFAAERDRIAAGYDGIDAAGRFGGAAETAAERFSAWASSLTDPWPVFVMSHLPLHAHRGDNRGAAIWCAALNRAAAARDVFVLFGHNHSTERRTRYDRRFYLIPSGAAMPVQGAAEEERTETRLDFTYLNAGYVLHGCGTVLTLSGPSDGAYETLTIRRCAADASETAFGDTGIASPYTVRLGTREGRNL